MDCTRGYDMYPLLFILNFYCASRDQLQTENTTDKPKKKKHLLLYIRAMAAYVNACVNDTFVQ